MKECKRHRWRLGAGSAYITKEGKLETEYTHVWCEKCDKKLKAYHNSKTTFTEYFKRRTTKLKRNGGEK